MYTLVMSPRLPDPLVAQNIANTVDAASKQVQEEMKNHNIFSELYRETVKSIDEKIILLGAGSISLLLTFMGILFNSSRDVTHLRYYFVIAAITSWLFSIILLLLSRWYEATYLSLSVHGHYLGALGRKTKAEIKMYKSYPNLVSADTLENFTAQELVKIVKDGEENYKLIQDTSKKTEKRESFYDKLNKISRISGHALFIVGYILATVFFLGVFSLMKS
ncbi:hypothetical protein BH09PAT4_BH09PAT4_05480 [soil metagenome]